MNRGSKYYSLFMHMIVPLIVMGCVKLPSMPADTCLPYEPKSVTISGVIIRETQPGPPNYESIADGDEPITFWYLKTAQPYCLPATSEFMEGGVSGVTEFQLVLDADQYEAYRSLVGRKVTVTGTLYLGHTGHHFKPILINVKELVLNESQNGAKQ